MPEKLLAVWSDSVLHQPGLPGVRGFGGRIYFYQTEGADPVKVDGALAVYVFDADQLDPYNQKPLRKFAFTADQFQDHFSSTTLGPSYSVWLPWDEVGGQARKLSLIARFEGRAGGTALSDPVIKLLPGLSKTTAESPLSSETSPNPIRMVGHQEHTSRPIVPLEMLHRRDVQTIELPPSFRKHLTTESTGTPTGTPSGTPTMGSQPPSDAAKVSQPTLPNMPGEPAASGVNKPKRDIRQGISLDPPRASLPPRLSVPQS